MDMRKAVLVQSAILGAAFALPAYAAPDGAPQAPTVAGCMERLGKTEAECTEMIATMKERRPPDGGQRGDGGDPRGQREGRGDGQGMGTDEGKEHIETAAERIAKVRSERQRRYERMEGRIGKLIAYLDEQGADTSAVKEQSETFASKAAGISSAYDGYVAALEAFDADGSEANRVAVVSAKEHVRALIIDVSEYYRSTLMPSLRTLIDSLA